MTYKCRSADTIQVLACHTLEPSALGSEPPTLDILASESLAETPFTAGQQLYLVNPKGRSLFNIHIPLPGNSQAVSLNKTKDGFITELGPTECSQLIPMTREVTLRLTNASKLKLAGLAKGKGHKFSEVDRLDMKLKGVFFDKRAVSLDTDVSQFLKYNTEDDSFRRSVKLGSCGMSLKQMHWSDDGASVSYFDAPVDCNIMAEWTLKAEDVPPDVVLAGDGGPLSACTDDFVSNPSDISLDDSADHISNLIQSEALSLADPEKEV